MKLLLFIILSLISIRSYSQLNLTVILNKNLDTAKITFLYIDGGVIKYIKPLFIENVTVITESIQSKYARLIVNYPDALGRMPGRCFLVSRKKSLLLFKEVADTVLNKIASIKTKNLIDVTNDKVYKQINNYAKSELEEFDANLRLQNNTLTDHSAKILKTSYEKLAFKQLEYIRNHGNNYYYFDKFAGDIVPSLMSKHLQELYDFFNISFSRKIRESYEGRTLKTLFEGNLLVKIGMQSPSFKTADYKGMEVSSDDLKGKFYLLSFWATWCSPCVAEIPQLKKIRNQYTSDKLEMISVSHDADSLKFITGIDKYKMDWIHIFNRPDIINLFGRKPIPSLYVIDRNGKMIFSSWEKSLDSLEAILSTKMND